MDWTAPLSALFPTVQGAVLYAMWRRPVPMTGRQVHRMTGGGSYTGALAALARLVDQGMVTARQSGQATEYVLNVDHVLYPVLDGALQAFRPRALFEQRLVGLVRDVLPDRDGEVTLACFGSYARGEASVTSDVDLLLVLPDDATEAEEERVVDGLERRGASWAGNDVQVYAIRSEALARAVEQADPIVGSWHADARTLVGPDVRGLLAQRRERAT